MEAIPAVLCCFKTFNSPQDVAPSVRLSRNSNSRNLNSLRRSEPAGRQLKAARARRPGSVDRRALTELAVEGAVAEEVEVERLSTSGAGVGESDVSVGEFSSGMRISSEAGKDELGDRVLESPAEVGGEKESLNFAEILEDEEVKTVSPELLAREVAKRRNFAIISHPDAGKTTLTEKLLLYGGAIHEAGAVKARKTARHATSDWMELEKQRGISITSTALVFETQGRQITLLDTPGHQDFGEDTYRTLAAADNAVMLVDAGKGLEPQTRKLFEVCRMRMLPCFTFINKMDRPALEPLELVDQIEKEFGLATYPVNWPIGSGDRFMGVYHRPRKEVHIFSKEKHGTKAATTQIIPWGDASLEKMIPRDLFAQLEEEIELLEELSPPLDMEKIHNGDLSPVFFGSAMNNFGVELFLETFLQYAVPPSTHESDIGEVDPEYPNFTGFVFKLQANMDPKHRDKVAFVRVCSGQFTKGMKVRLARNGKTIALTRPQKMFAQDRTTMETGYAGDVIGLNNPNAFCIGDTLYCGPRRSFPGIPSFSPELFCYMRNPNPSKYKQFLKGVTELLGEGAVQVLYSSDPGRTDPILAAVGQLQFEVVQYRMQAEYGVETNLEPIGYSVARWVTGGWPALEGVGKLYNCATVKDQWGRPVLLFRNEWNVSQLLGEKPEIGELAPYALPPAEVIKK
ncbi:peptide chain release factor 3 [Marchantia polymorpha subsp. ruderalis]|uniref:Tr-type G domain-containing protein n=2 Tax=Marchantia polymorpha TaxID=3197 RepID=A0A176WMT1_MARPO|nr:hypothetical protein AXG93_1054s1550 [Marchantia polymorpha subsp. ruderalis]PTQ41894.1 hypothetical protein MARPO_0032s0082 [Marchantia polymorpha]BBN11680.1 hypothetical protein Mp_5g13920 [Marchantia polymorpha subsp. ruderalis]|eukprot:PTQ41894.1 hypothetical protein MARPO_0032s0082 [Marchantia polymorpha]